MSIDPNWTSEQISMRDDTIATLRSQLAAKVEERGRLRDFIERMERVRRCDPDQLVKAWDRSLSALKDQPRG